MNNENIEDIETNEIIQLGGFPPIIFISNETKKKREFKKKIEENINTENVSKLNILGIKNILGKNDNK